MIGAMPSATLPGLTNRSSDSIGSRSQHKLVLHLRPPNTTTSPEATPRPCHDKKIFFQLSVVLPLLGGLLLFLSTCTPLFEDGTGGILLGVGGILAGIAITVWRLGWLGTGPAGFGCHRRTNQELQLEFQDVELNDDDPEAPRAAGQAGGGEKG